MSVGQCNNCNATISLQQFHSNNYTATNELQQWVFSRWIRHKIEELVSAFPGAFEAPKPRPNFCTLENNTCKFCQIKFMTFSHLGKFLALSSILCFHEKQIECVKDLSSPSPNPQSPFLHFCFGPYAENYAGRHLGEAPSQMIMVAVKLRWPTATATVSLVVTPNEAIYQNIGQCCLRRLQWYFDILIRFLIGTFKRQVCGRTVHPVVASVSPQPPTSSSVSPICSL